MKRIFPFLFTFLLLCLTGCSAAAENGYTQIDQETAKEMMATDGTQIVVDVRTREEYDYGHIPGAICIPNESIGCDSPEALPDYDQVILIYCRSSPSSVPRKPGSRQEPIMCVSRRWRKNIVSRFGRSSMNMMARTRSTS